MLVVRTLGAPPPPPRRRRRGRQADVEGEPSQLPLSRVTAIRAHAPFEREEAAAAWLTAASESEEETETLLVEAAELLNRALHAQAVASADPHGQVLAPQRAVAARVGYGEGEEVADSRFTSALEIDPRTHGASRRQRREAELAPQERVAAALGGREPIDACETLLLRARADLDAGREREATLQLRVGLEALLVELDGALADPGHAEDMATLTARRQRVGEIANAALSRGLDRAQAAEVEELLEICERILRRRRVLRG